jgi:ribosomal protein L7/L12
MREGGGEFEPRYRSGRSRGKEQDVSKGAEVQWGELRPLLRQINDRLDHMEAFLVASAQRNGPAYTLFDPGGAPASSAEVVELARAGKTIEAIKAYRQQTGLGLDDAKTVVLGI